jgi:membrane protein YqaA with SNARE-associated domain
MDAEWWITVGSALGVGLMSGAAPVALAEATALGAAAVPDLSLRVIVIVAFTAGHVAGKGVWYWIGTLESHVTRPALRRWIDRAHTVAATHPTLSLGVTASSATVSVPPFHLMAVAAGIVRSPAAPFFIVAFLGRLVRFSAIAAFPSAMRYLFVT